VDQEKRPGRFIFLGSTEFSHMWNIREALTGRISRVRIHPLTVNETLSKKLSKSAQAFYLSSKSEITRNELLKYLASGGLPGIFAIRNISERTNRFKDWLELTCFRDIKNIPVGKFDGDLCLRILEGVARLEEPDLPTITKYVKRDRRIVSRHLEALRSLFVLNVLPPHPLGTGKDLYFIFDVGLLENLGGDFEKKLWTWSLNEILAKYSYTENYKKRLFYYRARNGGIVHLLEENVKVMSALKLLSTEKFSSLDLRILTALRAKSKSEINLFAAGSTKLSLKEDKIEIYPWESLA